MDPMNGAGNTPIFGAAHQICESFQYHFFKGSLESCDCREIAQKVDNSWKDIQGAGISLTESVAKFPKTAVIFFHSIDESMPFFGIGKVLQVLVLIGVTWAVYDHYRGPQVHTYDSKDFKKNLRYIEIK